MLVRYVSALVVLLACDGFISEPVQPESDLELDAKSVSFPCSGEGIGEARALRRLTDQELRAHATHALFDSELPDLAQRIDALFVGVPRDAGNAHVFASENLSTQDGHVAAYVDLAAQLRALIATLPDDALARLSGGCTTPDCAGWSHELGLRLFRRPLSLQETSALSRYLASVEVDSTADLIGAAFEYLFLLPPSLLHLEDQGELDAAGPGVWLTKYDALNRVYFALTGGPPPVEALRRLADAPDGGAVIETEVDRILGSPKFEARVLAFFEEWLGFGPDVDLSALPAALVGDVDLAALPREAYDELRAFIRETVFSRAGGVSELLRSTEVYAMGPNLALVYGLSPNATPSPAAPLSLSSPQGGGLLSRAAMNLHGAPRTSPISRGVRVIRKLFCQDIAPPDDLDLEAAAEGVEGSETDYSNQRWTTLRTGAPGCASCHEYINGIGFALEVYDPLGRYRTVEQVFDVEGELLRTFAIDTQIPIRVLHSREQRFGSAEALAQEMDESERVSACFVTQWRAFTVQADRHAADKCASREAHDVLVDARSGILEMIRQDAIAQLGRLRTLDRDQEQH